MAIKKILTDLNTDGNIGIGTDPSYYIDVDKTSVDNDETRGLNIELSKENTSGAGFASNVYGVKSHAIANSSEVVVNIGGVWSKAEHTGSGRIYYATGGTNRAYHSGSGDSSVITGTFSEARVSGTGSGAHDYIAGVNSIAKLDNVNATTNWLQGQHCTVQLNAGEVIGEINPLILDIDNTGGTITGDVTYLRIQNDTFASAVGGTARAIYSLSLFPSEFAGSIQSPTFNVGATAGYLKENSNQLVELYGEQGIEIETGDGANITIDEQISITAANIVSDSAITATSFIKDGGTSAQFLKADGSVDTTVYSGDQDLSGYLLNTTDTLEGQLTVDNTNTLMLDLKRSGNLKARFFADSNHAQLEMYNSSNAVNVRLRASGDSYFNGGDVGIGTASPESLLHAKAADGVTAVIKIEGGNATSTTSGEINSQLDFGSNDASVNNTDNVGGRISSVTENTNGALVGMAFSTFQQGRTIKLQEAMRITNEGNVGIGTTSPEKLFTLNQKADNDGIRIYGHDDHSNAYGDISLTSGGNLKITHTNPDSSGYIQINAENYLQLAAGSFVYTDDIFRIYDAGRLDFGSSGDYKIDYNATSDILNIHTSGNEGMTVDSDGNVGIGTDDPSEKLDVAGNILLQATTGGNSKTKLIPSVSGGNSVLTVKGGNFNHNIPFETSWNNFEYAKLKASYNTSDSDFSLNKSAADGSVAGTTKISTGDSYFNSNVGIGTTSPTEKLDVSGNILISDPANDKYFGSNVDLILNADADENSGVSARNIIFQNRGSEKMRIDADGNVGIGITSPTQKLSVDGGIRGENYYGVNGTDDKVKGSMIVSGDEGVLKLTNGANYGLMARGAANNPYIGAYQGGSLIFRGFGTNTTLTHVDDVDLMKLNFANQRVGIGTMSPTRKLDVEHDGWDGLEIRTASADGSGINLINSQRNFALYSRSNAFHIRDITDSDTPRFVIGSTGKVGIGTDSPTEKLDVNGTITNSNGTARIQSVANQNVEIASTRDIRLFIDSNNDDTDNRFEIQSNTSVSNDSNIVFVVEQDGKTGVGTNDPQAQLDVNGGIRMGNDTATASASNVGTQRYYADSVGSYVDMVMQTDSSTYAWVNIVRNIFSV